MIIALPFCEADREQAVDLVDWLATLGPFPNHDLLLVRDYRAKPIADPECFKSFKELMVRDPVQGWPMGANAAFLTAGKYVEYKDARPWLWLEADALPLYPKAFDDIEAEYWRAVKAGKKFLGDLAHGENAKPSHMSGVAVYPAHLSHFAPKAYQPGNLPFDKAAGKQTLPLMQQSELILHSWNREGKGLAPFGNWNEFEAKVLSRRPKCALFHSDKSGSLLKILRDRQTWGNRAIAAVDFAAPGTESETILPAPALAELVEGAPAFKDGETFATLNERGEINECYRWNGNSKLWESMTDVQVKTWPQSEPWADRKASIAEIRAMAARLFQFQTSSPRVRFVRELLREAGVIVLPYRHKRRKGWKHNPKGRRGKAKAKLEAAP